MGESETWDDRSRRRNAHTATFLVREIGSLGRDLDEAMRDHLTVNATDLRAMSVLVGRGPLTASELATALGASAPTTSMAIDRLERLGHVTRERDESDRRRVVVHPTPTSSAKAREALLPMIRDIDGLLDRRTPQERAIVQRYLQEVAETMRDHVEMLRATDQKDET